mgnify:FL=1
MFLLLLSLLATNTASAEKLNLKDAIERALLQNGELRAQGLQIRQAEQDVRRVSGEFGPKFEALGGIGPITRATGNATASSEEKGSIGRMLIGKFSLTQPLFAWGRKGNYNNAALAGVNVEEAEFSGKEEEIRFQVKEAY